MMKKIWDELSQSIKQVYDWIEKENQSYFNIINENTNLAESSYTDLEKLLIKAFVEKPKEGIRQIQQSIEKEEVYQMKEDLFEILTYIQDIDESLYQKILEILRREKVLDVLKFLSNKNNQNFYESLSNKQQNIKDVKKQIMKITNVLRNIQDHKFNKYDYSQETNEKERLNLINRMKNNKGIIDFIRFLVLLTSIDGKFIQSGSNGLNLCVGMKVDIRNKSFENIRIKNTSLIGGNFVRCNLSGSEFENVDISGVNFMVLNYSIANGRT
ncbi:unnamed protein product [Paramecium primaurelia]|uniref:Pentapeptide repeat-containing protein n=1 Tax=Paramecium primaurelia TaxID=5886 RepID=A0A8S1NYK4_PARPR|nr:unnamed protein product [Paramecium primaurelia]